MTCKTRKVDSHSVPLALVLFLTSLFLFFSTTLRAQNSELEIISKESWKEFQELQKKKPQIHAFMEKMLERRLAIDLTIVLKKRGMNEHDILEVLKSAEFNAMSQKLIQDQEVQNRLQQTLDQALSPANLLRKIAKARANAQEDRGLEEQERIQKVAWTRTIHQEEKTLAKDGALRRIWNMIRRGLFE